MEESHGLIPNAFFSEIDVVFLMCFNCKLLIIFLEINTNCYPMSCVFEVITEAGTIRGFEKISK